MDNLEHRAIFSERRISN